MCVRERNFFCSFFFIWLVSRPDQAGWLVSLVDLPPSVCMHLKTKCRIEVSCMRVAFDGAQSCVY